MKPVSCINPGGTRSYGGSQMWFNDKIPVIMLVRAPFNNVTLIADAEHYGSENIGQHFVTVTDIDEENGCLVVSSWGRRYKIACSDLERFSVSASFCYIDPIKSDKT